MNKLKKFKDFKRKTKTSIKKVSDKPFSFVPIVNKMSPAPAVAFGISKINLD